VRCKISPQGINYLHTHGQKLLSQLSDLNLDFDKCFECFSVFQRAQRILKKITGIEEFSKLAVKRKLKEPHAQKGALDI